MSIKRFARQVFVHVYPSQFPLGVVSLSIHIHPDFSLRDLYIHNIFHYVSVFACIHFHHRYHDFVVIDLCSSISIPVSMCLLVLDSGGFGTHISLAFAERCLLHTRCSFCLSWFTWFT